MESSPLGLDAAAPGAGSQMAHAWLLVVILVAELQAEDKSEVSVMCGVTCNLQGKGAGTASC